ncbi:MAG: DNA mismatch repair protein MutS [Pseudomonadota bacterium]|nr:DNA mismatch repair protein MutS [Pseudomonadota bacterium]
MTPPLSTSATPKVKSPTPMIAQYLSVKFAHPDSLLFYRMGDFYEMFFEDAEIGASVLGITLTKRGKSDGDDIPMCGVPVHSVDGYLARLIGAGHRVAICEQVEDPDEQKKRGGKGPLRREVIRILTPGTLTEDDLLVPRANNYLAAIGRSGDAMAVAWADISTGDFAVQETDQTRLEGLLSMLNPAELISLAGARIPDAVAQHGILCTEQAPSLFDSAAGQRALCDYFGIASLDGFGRFSRSMTSAAGALLAYIELTQKGNLPRLRTLQPVTEAGYMEIDPATRRSLEITRTLSGDRQGSLLAAIDQTITAGGARLLAQRIGAPLADAAAINRRLDLVSWFATTPDLSDTLRSSLKAIPDIDRALSRLSLGHGGPRDLDALARGMVAGSDFVAAAGQNQARLAPPEDLAGLYDSIMTAAPLADEMAPALGDDLPLLARDGGFVRSGFDAALDELRLLRDESRRLIAALQQEYCTTTGISSLKVKHNNVLGYHVDVRNTHGEKLMQDDRFIHRQTTAQSVRFTTTELAELERDMSSAADRALARELDIFERLRAMVLARAEALSGAAAALAQLDVAIAAAVMATSRHYCRPDISDGVCFNIEKGRHTVVETMLPAGDSFIPNDCQLGDSGDIWLITGPNMAGKSTFLRQNAHIAIMAQAGLFVPAESARIGVIDRLFSRVGAADDLARGRSTFMVEMVETAAILNRATERSFVILDEIGRGTATYDGLSIAWASLEHLHESNRCRTLFATHYHELTNLRTSLERLSCHSMKVREWEGEIIFLHQVVDGAADRSYGVHVARLAGLPAMVISRAQALLSEMEAGGHGVIDAGKLSADLPLFDHDFTADIPPSAPGDRLRMRLEEINPDLMAPRDALEILYELRALLADEADGG